MKPVCSGKISILLQEVSKWPKNVTPRPETVQNLLLFFCCFFWLRITQFAKKSNTIFFDHFLTHFDPFLTLRKFFTFFRKNLKIAIIRLKLIRFGWNFQEMIIAWLLSEIWNILNILANISGVPSIVACWTPEVKGSYRLTHVCPFVCLSVCYFRVFLKIGS